MESPRGREFRLRNFKKREKRFSGRGAGTDFSQ